MMDDLLEDQPLMLAAADIFVIADHERDMNPTVTCQKIAARIRQFVSSSLSAVEADSGALPVPAIPPAHRPGREVQFTKETTR